MLKIYDTFGKKKKNIKKKKIIIIYVCGMTVHNYCHIGHARIFIFFDTIIRYLKLLKKKVVYIRNITDIDDKIINKAKKNGKSIKNISEKFTEYMHKDLKNLNIIEPTFEPKATNFIKFMIKDIKKLNILKYAYIGNNGDIYYNISKFYNYGKLSNRKLVNSNYIKTNKYKISNLDFTLWKISKEKKYSWKTKLGKGKPGWHTECSSIISYYSNKGIDIHGGGKDLLFPHHENEIAQFEIVNKNKLAKIWIHIGFLNINKKKMSKSLKNFITIKNLLKNLNEEYIRFFMLSTHYKKDIEYSILNINKSKLSLDKLYKYLNNFINLKCELFDNYIKKNFLHAINNDFNIPKAISILFNIINKKNVNQNYKEKLAGQLKYLGNILGILKYNPNNFLKKKYFTKNKKYTQTMITKRNIARKLKNWKLADKIRKKLEKLGIQLKDNKHKTIFIKK